MSTVDLLIGKRIFVRGNDFVGAQSVGRVLFVELESNSILIELDTPVHSNGSHYTHAIASPRLARDSLATLLSTGMLGCGVTWIPNTRFRTSTPFDLSWWRGGATAIVDIVM